MTVTKAMLKIMAISFVVGLTMMAPSFASDQMVNIGLRYGVNSAYPVGVSSDTGFQFGIDANGAFEPLIDLSNYKSLILYKAGFYENQQLVTSNASYYASGNVKGAYTLRIGQSESQLAQIYDQFLAYKAQSEAIMLVYDGQWYIGSGFYVNEAAANEAIKSLQNVYAGIHISIMKQSQHQMVVYGDQMPLVSYDTSLHDFVLKTTRFEYNEIVYRNSIMVKRLKDSDYSVINRLSLQEYLYGVVPKEMSPTWPVEALKAQAVAARNFTLQNLGKHINQGFDICNTTECQVYGGASAESPLSNKAVDDTKDEVLYYEGEIISCYYHANSGGETEDLSNIWSGDLPYIKGVLDPYSLNQPNATWMLTLSAEDIKSKMLAAGYDIGLYQGVEINERSEHGRVVSITLKGSKGSATLPKEKMRAIFGYTVVKSMYFTLDETTERTLSLQGKDRLVQTKQSSLYTISAKGVQNITTSAYSISTSGVTPIVEAVSGTQKSGNQLTLYGKGYGHGLGMSQWGAYTMAESGENYETILKHYFTGTTLGKTLSN